MRIEIDDVDELLDAAQVASKLGVSVDTVRRMAARRDIDHVRIGSGRGRIMITPDAVVDYLNRHHTTAIANAPKQRARKKQKQRAS